MKLVFVAKDGAVLDNIIGEQVELNSDTAGAASVEKDPVLRSPTATFTTPSPIGAQSLLFPRAVLESFNKIKDIMLICWISY